MQVNRFYDDHEERASGATTQVISLQLKLPIVEKLTMLNNAEILIIL